MSDEPSPHPAAASWLEAIVRSSDDAIIGKDLHGRILTWNHGAERLYEYSEEEAIGQPISFIIPPGQADEFNDIMSRIRRGERVPPYETLRRSKSGATLAVSLSVSPIRDATGTVVGASAIARDITARRRVDAALRASEARWQAIVHAAIDGIVVIDERGVIESFNAGAEQLFGYREASLVGKNVNILMPAPYHDEHDGYLARHAATGERHIIGIGRQVSGRRCDGTEFPLHLSVGEIVLGTDRKFVGILHDLSERIRAEERMREQTALARLGQMAAVIAHEVRNPLAAVSGALQVIGQSLASDGHKAAVKEILARLDSLNTLTKDLLLFARPPQPTIDSVHLTELLRVTALLFSTDKSMADIRIDIEESADEVRADASLLQIVFQNLLTNAAQAMKGTGTIGVSTTRQVDAILLTIHDTGPGIPADVRAKLFQPFMTTKARGTGLGLSIAKQFVEAMHGTIAVECPSQGGTSVLIRLPTEPRPTTVRV